jgi:hypothetical protein
MEEYTREELINISRILLFGLHLQATEAGNGSGLSTRTVISGEIWDKMYEGELTFYFLVNPDGDLVITTQLQTT